VAVAISNESTKLPARWKGVVGDKGKAMRKDPRHRTCAYGCGGRDREGLD
jgi:hypothetical protein